LSRSEQTAIPWPVNGTPNNLVDRTRRVYDRLAAVYPVSTMLFHSRAHRCALGASGVGDGMKVLEVATGSGEMFRRLVRVNSAGTTVGVDLSPNMAARTLRTARSKYPAARTHCQAVDARQMPFRDGEFDAIFSCYLMELLPFEDVVGTLGEFRRILRDRGSLTLVLIGQNKAMFNAVYKVVRKMAPAFWGPQMEERLPELMESARFQIVKDQMVRQTFYPSRVLVARK
jgi:ubiquinone/menaquinone biosynthesis C-methylase UbiE